MSCCEKVNKKHVVSRSIMLNVWDSSSRREAWFQPLFAMLLFNPSVMRLLNRLLKWAFDERTQDVVKKRFYVPVWMCRVRLCFNIRFQSPALRDALLEIVFGMKLIDERSLGHRFRYTRRDAAFNLLFVV